MEQPLIVISFAFASATSSITSLTLRMTGRFSITEGDVSTTLDMTDCKYDKVRSAWQVWAAAELADTMNLLRPAMIYMIQKEKKRNKYDLCNEKNNIFIWI